MNKKEISEIEKFNFILHLIMSKQITAWNNVALTGKVGYICPTIENHTDPEISATY